MNSPEKRIFFGKYAFYVSKNVYEPAEDTFLLAENLIVNQSDDVLDVGTGCGILGVLAAKKAKKVVAVDINPHAVRCAQMNAGLNNVVDKIDVRLGHMFEPISKDEKFNVIVFNAPYLPSERSEQKTWIGKAWAGGASGREIIDHFVSRAPQHLVEKGRIILVQSTLSNVDETMQKLEEEGLVAIIVAEKKVAFETIVVIRGESRPSSI
ncbi:MAG: tRNA (adenine(22)-N(1))-methyltransferase TrmK [Candidatus Bathyarchaeota archaeon]|nr:MAG: tRNA (adenine(22)-N(1))-methyltransferase TrmK [Candidatus Bathyarchaeota archaeon]